VKRWIGRILAALAVLLVPAVIGFVWWGAHPLKAGPEAIAALEGDDEVRVSYGEWIEFRPAAGVPATGLIIYPGGHVEASAYAPLAKALARSGYFAVIPQMPLSLAVLKPDEAQEIMLANPDITSWIIGGHSLGGAMAAEFVATHPHAVKGLFLWAAYSVEGTDLSGLLDLEMLSIFGSQDGGVERMRASRDRLPPSAAWVEIPGGNHAQFGWYGLQPGDGTATISATEQQRIVVDHMLELIESAAD